MDAGKPSAAALQCPQLRLLCHENAVLARALSAAQQRAAKLQDEKDAEVACLCALLIQIQARNAALEAENIKLHQLFDETLASREGGVQNGSAGRR